MTTSLARAALAFVGLVSTIAGPGCVRTAPPEGQLLVYLDTDAPAPLFDRARIDVFAPGLREPCAGCSREVSLDDGRLAKGDASFGVITRVGTPGYRARAVLFRSGNTASGAPRRGSSIERVVSLPAIASDGVVAITITLPASDLAKPKGTLDAPLEADPGPPRPGYAGSLGASSARGCSGAARDDDACVPGGVFWMGNPRLDELDAREADGRSERLVVVSPYFLDRREITIAEMRAAGVARVVDDPQEAGGPIAGCLYTADPGPSDALPVNCLSWQRARAYCAKVGKRLPTEVEWELAAGARESRSFPWGGDLPRCGDAVFMGLGCEAARPAIAGSGIRDRVTIGGVELVDLAGNLREFVADRFRRGDDPCWGEGVLVDPVCNPASSESPIARSVRGGSFRDEGTLLRTAIRTFVEDERYAVSEVVGFRCARDGK